MEQEVIKGDGVVATEKRQSSAPHRSGRFDKWKQMNRVSLPTGVQGQRNSGPGGEIFRHDQVTMANHLDKLSGR